MYHKTGLRYYYDIWKAKDEIGHGVVRVKRMYLLFAGVELKLWVSFGATLFFFFDLGLKYNCLVVWVDPYCLPFV